MFWVSYLKESTPNRRKLASNSQLAVLGMVEVRSLNIKNTHTDTELDAFTFRKLSTKVPETAAAGMLMGMSGTSLRTGMGCTAHSFRLSFTKFLSLTAAAQYPRHVL